MRIHFVILQPSGFIHSLGFLDSARYLKHYFAQLGYCTSISKNRPISEAINIIFGAHLEIRPSWLKNYCCVIFNQEQLGEGGAQLSEDYIPLLRQSHVLEYDEANFGAYSGFSDDVGLLRTVAPLLNASYLFDINTFIAPRDRPIDLLFIGGMNESRAAVISRIEKCGLEVAHFVQPMFGPERDAYIKQARAVLNIPFYASTRFERTRVFNALSLGTPVVSLRRPDLHVDPAFDESVHWFDDESLEGYFTQQFKTEEWYQRSDKQLKHWRKQDALESYAQLAKRLESVWDGWLRRRERDNDLGKSLATTSSPKDVVTLNLSPQRGYMAGWCNVAQPGGCDNYDAVLDWNRLLSTDVIELQGTGDERWLLSPGKVERAYIYWGASELPPDPLLQQLTRWLKPDGVLIIDKPLGLFAQAPVSDTSMRIWMESLIRGSHEEFLRRLSGPQTLALENVRWLEDSTCVGGGIMNLARITFTCRPWTPREMVIRRTIRDDFGELPLDD